LGNVNSCHVNAADAALNASAINASLASLAVVQAVVAAGYVGPMVPFFCSQKAYSKKAFLVGMGKYNKSALSGPAKDVPRVKRKLEYLNWVVTVINDTDKHTLMTSYGKWLDTLQKGDSCFFYFTGHGMKDNGRQYLVPLKAKGDSYDDKYINLNEVLRLMVKKELALKCFLIDACATHRSSDCKTKSLSDSHDETLDIRNQPVLKDEFFDQGKKKLMWHNEKKFDTMQQVNMSTQGFIKYVIQNADFAYAVDGGRGGSITNAFLEVVHLHPIPKIGNAMNDILRSNRRPPVEVITTLGKEYATWKF